MSTNGKLEIATINASLGVSYDNFYFRGSLNGSDPCDDVSFTQYSRGLNFSGDSAARKAESEAYVRLRRSRPIAAEAKLPSIEELAADLGYIALDDIHLVDSSHQAADQTAVEVENDISTLLHGSGQA